MDQELQCGDVDVEDALLLGRAAESLVWRGGALEGRLTLLPPQASDRRYLRWCEGPRSEIAMLLPAEGGGAEEVGSCKASSVAEESFVLVGRWLSGLGVPVPEIGDIDETRRIIWVEDLGSEDFFERVSKSPEMRQAAYREAIGLLLELRSATMEAVVPPLVATRSMDAALLRWECDHYIEWRLEAGLGLQIAEPTLDILRSGMDSLVAAIGEIPQGVVHRDVQSRNLMFDQTGRLRLLDFQDALMGPLVYDVVALLRDSYVVLPESELDALVEFWAREMVSRGLSGGEGEEKLVGWFHLQTVQRKLKDAGRFVYLAEVKGNRSFLPFVEDSVAYAALALRRLPELSALRSALSALDPGI